MSDAHQPASDEPSSGLIAIRHAEYEAVLGLARSVRKAKVAIVGSDADAHRGAIEAELRRARAEIVATPGPGTSFVVVAGDASDDELLGAADDGALLLRPEDVAPLVDAYVALWTPGALEAATRRAKEEAKQAAVHRTREVKAHGDAWRARLAGDQARRLGRAAAVAETDSATVGGRSYLSRQEMLIQERAREGRIATPHRTAR